MTLFLFVMGLLLLFYEVASTTSLVTFLLTLLVFLIITKITSLESQLTRIETLLNEMKGKKQIPATPKQEESTIQAPKQAIVQKTQTQHAVSEVAHPTKSTQSDTESPVITWIKKYIFSGNPIAKIGVVILFFGVAFLFKYAIQHTHIPIEFRLIAVAVGGVAMIGLGWLLPAEKKNYANILQGGGIGLIYLTVYAAFAYYHVLSVTPAFTLLVAITLLSGIVAVLQDAKPLAIFGILGGFLAPLLISTGENNYIFLFTYYVLLNMAILALAWFKAWRELNLIGFIFTFSISALWGYQSYHPDYFTTTEPFLIYFFLFYIVITLLFTQRQKNYIDTTITFGTPIVAFCLQAGITNEFTYGLAWSAFALFVFYSILAYTIYLFKSERQQNLVAAFSALAVLFGSLTIPYAVSRIWFISLWAVESIFLLWFGAYQKQLLTRIFAAVLLFTSTYLYVFYAIENHGFITQYYLSGLLVMIANLSCAYLFYKQEHDYEINTGIVFFAIGAIGWYYINLYEIHSYISYDYRLMTNLMFIASSSLVFFIISEFLNWNYLRYLSLVLLPAIFLISIPSHPVAYYQAHGVIFSWIYSIAVLYFILYRHEKFPENYLPTLHFFSFIFLTWFISNRLDLMFQNYESLPFTWQFISYGFVSACMLYLANKGRSLLAWPLRRYETNYLYHGGLVLTLFIGCWFFMSNFLSADVKPFYYLPLLNILDLTIALAFLSIYFWSQAVWPWLTKSIQANTLLGIFCFSIFVWLNAVLLRTISQWMLIPYSFDDLWNTNIVQTSFSIFWTILALVATFVAARTQQRVLWFLGFALIGIVVVKLIFIDLSGTNTIGRIIAFIGVGILLLINGYISPLPPKK